MIQCVFDCSVNARDDLCVCSFVNVIDCLLACVLACSSRRSLLWFVVCLFKYVVLACLLDCVFACVSDVLFDCWCVCYLLSCVLVCVCAYLLA